MQFEYFSLLVMTIFYLFAWIPSSIGKYKSFGWEWISSNRMPQTNKELLEWAGRAERAYINLKDYFPGFVVAVFMLGIFSKFDHSTSWAAGLYVAGRMGHLFSYILGSVNFRFVFYVLSMASNLFLLLKCI